MMRKPFLLDHIDNLKYEAQINGKPFSEYAAEKNHVEEAKKWCLQLMWHHFQGYSGTFMWNGVRIIEEK